MGSSSQEFPSSRMLKYISLTILLTGLTSSEIVSQYALLVPKVPEASAKYYSNNGVSGGSGYNPGASGGSGYNPGVSGGSGYNPGVNGGSGYNPGSNNGGSGYNPGYNSNSYDVVAFSAKRADSCCRGMNSRIRFDRSLTNLGGGWDGRTGEFTAPASGTYSFSWSALSPDRQQLRLSLMMNGLEMSSSWADSAGYQSSSGSTVLTLRRGDTVALVVTDGEVFEPRDSRRGTPRSLDTGLVDDL